MKAVPCPICKKDLAKSEKNFPFCSARCKLVDAGNWFDGNYFVEAAHPESRWKDN